MTYMEKIKRNNKEYYYLTKNVRISINKWKKIRIYMGDIKPSKEEIEKYAKEIENKIKELKIKKEYNYYYLTDEDAEVLEDLKEGFKEWLKKTPKSLKEKLNEDFVIRFTYHSNAIEGNRLTLRQTALIDKVIPTGIRAEDYNEAINGKECLDFIKNYKEDFNQKLITKVNNILTKNTGVTYPGRIRFFEVQIFGSKHTPPTEKEVKKHLSNLYKWYSANKIELHPFELAVILHHKLAWIHPFEDARTIMNFILMKKEYPMFFIPFEKREDYYKCLEIADKGNYKKYVSEMLHLIIDQIRNYKK